MNGPGGSIHSQAPARRLLALAAPFARRMALAALLGFLTVASGIGLLATSAYLISRAALQPSIADLQVAIVGVRFFGIARGLARYLERTVSHDVTFRLLARLRVWFYAALEPLAPARLWSFRSGDLLGRVVADVEVLENFYLRVLAPLAVALLSSALVLLLLGSLDARLALSLLAFLVLAGAALPLLARGLARSTGREMVRARSELNATLVEGIPGVGELLALGAGEEHLARTQRLGRRLGELQGRMARISGLERAASGLLVNAATAAVVAVAMPLVTAGRLDGVYLAVVALVVIAAFEALLPLPAAFQALEANEEAARRLFEIVDAEPEVTDPPDPEPPPLEAGLRVEDLHFAYDALASGAPEVLAGVSFSVPPGAQAAIVGPSGAGKSTLVALLLRFWDYQRGKIWIGERELRELAPEDVHRLVAVVAQDTHLFNATVRENLLLARPGASEAELEEAAQQAGIHDDIAALPEGYDTWIGEQGLRLSGGQRQRLAIARAILKDAPLLLLDEPTANLDALAERQVLASLRALAAGRTTLLVTHRLAGLEAAHEILVLDAGRIVQRGSHAGLLQVEGPYRRMWRLQNSEIG
jgi:ATP-binding cassette, subfamily C, bacterial CydC